jgi:hypothetical protein
MNVATRIRRPLEVIVLVFDLKTGDEVRRHEVNFYNANRRGWLNKLLVWAWTNNHSVEIYNKVDANLAEVED